MSKKHKVYAAKQKQWGERQADRAFRAGLLSKARQIHSKTIVARTKG